MALSEITQLFSSKQILSRLDPIPPGSKILIDIDDTVITPASRFFRILPYRTFMDEIKRDKHLFPDYEIIVSNWRLQRKVMLVDPDWPEIIRQLKKKHEVYGFTKIDTGKFGHIESMEIWRYQELKELGIKFSENAWIESLPISNHFENPPVFYKGIFLSGSASKGEMASLYKEALKAPIVILIDDREEHILSVKKFCQEADIPFMGILYNATHLIPSFEPNSPIAEFQKNHLLQHKKWVEDEEAAYLIS